MFFFLFAFVIINRFDNKFNLIDTVQANQIDIINSLGLYWMFTQRVEDNPLFAALYETKDNVITGKYNSELIKKRLFSKNESLAKELLQLKNKGFQVDKIPNEEQLK